MIDKMTDGELLALALGTRASEALLTKVGDLEAIGRAPFAELQSAGLGKGTAKVAAVFELGRRAMTSRRMGVIGSPESVFQRLRGRFSGLKQEVFVAVAVDARNHVLAEVEIAWGTLTGVEVHPREVFRPLIRMSAAGCVIAHNHPSGDPTPSPEDIALTLRMRAVGELVGIPVMDHVVIAGDKYRSVAEWMGGLSE